MRTAQRDVRDPFAIMTMLVVAAAMIADGCIRPTLMLREDRRYELGEWDGGMFVFVTYRWHGGPFDDAVELEQRFVEWGAEQGLVQMPIGRFPSTRIWQLGFIASDTPRLSSFEGYPIHTMEIPAGTYARLTALGHPEKLFRYWDRFRRWLERDGHEVNGPVIEVYTDLLAPSVPPDERMGELRYSVSGLRVAD